MEINSGLEDVYIKHTALTSIDGDRGELRYRGYDIRELVASCTFEEVAYLLLNGELPTSAQLKSFREEIERAYELPAYVRSVIDSMPEDADALSTIMVAYASLSGVEGNYVWSEEKDRGKAAEILGRANAIVACTYRHKSGLPIRMPEPSGSFAESFLDACFGKAEKDRVSVMDRALMLYADHEVPASTTAAIVSASTLSDMYSCLAAAIAALKGPLHGGAAEAAYTQFLEIGNVSNADRWFSENIASGRRRLMGFGHRVYRTYDPRALIFKSMAEKLAAGRERDTLATAERVEELGTERFASKRIYPNTDFYSGIVFSTLGFPLSMFTALFSLSRTVGLVAHISEYNEREPRLIRPRALYNGPAPRVLEKPGQ